ncbi:MAG: phosphoribosylaminoimidazolesuccinocarboxamide synthase, partial [Parcubacteria group bacterium]|nr:phosphoribosylaminoimidazolesuccinocarboxamide synthase [Parcubacteria group bacterium]
MGRRVIVADGKSKRIVADNDENGIGIVEVKEDITSGDGKRRDVVRAKAAYSTTTICNVFRLLKQCG